MNNYTFLLMFFLLLLSCKHSKENKLSEYFTNDTISMWDMKMVSLQQLRDTTYYHNYFRSYLFQKDFICENYAKTNSGIRLIEILGSKPNYAGLCNKWEILNDSTIKLNCKNIFVVRIISKDTVHLIDTLGIKQHEMYRVEPPWNIDEESVRIRDKQIKTGEYLDNNIY